MTIFSIHNPDRYMADLRHILSQGRKRIGIVIGAGAATAIRVDNNNNIVSTGGRPLVPNTAGLTEAVMSSLETCDRRTIEKVKNDIDEPIDIEVILTRVRRLALAIGRSHVYGLDGGAYHGLGKRLCRVIGEKVSSNLPESPNPHTQLVAWIAGTQRTHAVEIFTTNYDLLIEEALERARLSYFDGFTGSKLPFFDAATVLSDDLPVRWSRLWKLHGSLGWTLTNDRVVRTGRKDATELIYPDHLKYDQVTRQPYSALFERLRIFLTTPDTLLLCSGFSFRDAHISALLDEALTANAHTAIFAFQYNNVNEEQQVSEIAMRRPNLSVFARDGAIINGVQGPWRPGKSPNEEWQEIRRTFWHEGSSDEKSYFLLGDFARLAHFLSLIQAQEMWTARAYDTGRTEEPPEISGAGEDRHT